MNCPSLILRAKKALAEPRSGQILRVVSTDPGSVKDFQAFARQTGNELVTQVKRDGGPVNCSCAGRESAAR